MSALFRGKFVKVSQVEQSLKNEKDEDVIFYYVTLSNGEKTFEISCGASNPLVEIPLYTQCVVDFDTKPNRKLYLACVNAVPYGAGSDKGGAKS